MIPRTLLVLGSGGHGKAVAEAALSSGEWQEVIFADDRWPELTQCFGARVVANISSIAGLCREVGGAVAAVGDNKRRQVWTAAIEAVGLTLVSVFHPRSFVSGSAQVGVGSVVMAGAIIGTNAIVGRGAIVNAGSVIDHDTILGEFAHLGVGVKLAGGVHIGEGAWLQAGCCAGYSVVIESGSVIAPGTVLFQN
ncbi:acetyltransferase [Pseudomonas oryzihabitans]|uniref:acetyltransferase n=1 Tax=Pseudomonas oryzihabitans TaxID=47885 RepID=UPI00289434F5|nr:acetyltransferase [Pseudomonas oryzihabitans]MDT3719473.1 acetyltransferase [Pseudomonas oryzihabitans]